jgi:hypothetical protein
MKHASMLSIGSSKKLEKSKDESTIGRNQNHIAGQAGVIHGVKE